MASRCFHFLHSSLLFFSLFSLYFSVFFAPFIYHLRLGLDEDSRSLRQQKGKKKTYLTSFCRIASEVFYWSSFAWNWKRNSWKDSEYYRYSNTCYSNIQASEHWFGYSCNRCLNIDKNLTKSSKYCFKIDYTKSSTFNFERNTTNWRPPLVISGQLSLPYFKRYIEARPLSSRGLGIYRATLSC